MRDKRGTQLPRARSEGLLVEELNGETLVYDLERDKAHCLNATAALVWKHCDGNTPVREIVQFLEESLETKVEDDVVWYALDRLEKDRLLEEPINWPAGAERFSRRTLVRRIGVAAVLLPLITTITAPTALANVSCSGSCDPSAMVSGCPSGCTCFGTGTNGTCINA